MLVLSTSNSGVISFPCSKAEMLMHLVHTIPGSLWLPIRKAASAYGYAYTSPSQSLNIYIDIFYYGSYTLSR